MIFNSDYDKVLWLILKNDRNNRERILEFIEGIPSNFLINIQNKINEYDEYKLDYSIDKEKKYFYGEYYDGDNYLYHFNIDKDSDTLFVGRNIFKYGKMFNDFGLLLSNGIDIKNMNEICEYVIGKVTYDFDILNDGLKTVQGKYKVIDYKFIDVILGNVIIITNKDRIMFNDIMRIVSVDDIPKNYNIDDVKRLVRKREKKNNI